MKAVMEEVVRSVSFINDPIPTIAMAVIFLGGTTILWLLGRFILYLIKRRWRDCRGAGTVEYALLVMLIAAVIVGALQLLGGSLESLYQLATTLFRVP